MSEPEAQPTPESGPQSAYTHSQLVADVGTTFGWTGQNARAVVDFIFQRVKDRALLQGARVKIPRFGVFDRRLSKHNNRAWNLRGLKGRITAPSVVLRFRGSRDFTRLKLDETAR